MITGVFDILGARTRTEIIETNRGHQHSPPGGRTQSNLAHEGDAKRKDEKIEMVVYVCPALNIRGSLLGNI